MIIFKKIKVANILIVVDTYIPDKTSGSKLISDLIKKLKNNNKVLLIVLEIKL